MDQAVRVCFARLRQHNVYILCAAVRRMVQRIMEWCSTSEDLRQYGMLFFVAYCFLLRLPSEALPITVGKDSGPCALYRDGEQIKLALRRRFETE